MSAHAIRRPSLVTTDSIKPSAPVTARWNDVDCCTVVIARWSPNIWLIVIWGVVPGARAWDADRGRIAVARKRN